jgi:hypothetical protein
LKIKLILKKKTEELLVKQLKSCERNMPEFRDSTKRPNLRFVGIEEGEKVQAKGIHNIFNNLLSEIFPNLKKILPIQAQEVSRTQNRLDQSRTSPQHTIIKTTNTENQERILKAVRGKKKQITYKGKSIKMTAVFSIKTSQARRAWNEVFQALKENNFSPRILYPAKL